jgi:hypothetical protein
MDGISEREFSSSEQYSWRSSRKNCQTSKNQAVAEETMIKNCEIFCGSSDISSDSFRVHIGHVQWVLEKKMKIFFLGRSMVQGG